MKKRGLELVYFLFAASIITTSYAAETGEQKVAVEEKEIIEGGKAEVSLNELTINIDNNYFTDTAVRLNTEIYEIAASVVNINHLSSCYSYADTQLFHSFKEHLTPLIPAALTTCETGSWADSRYTWSPVIYSRQLAEADVDMSRLEIRQVNANTYLANGIMKELGCGNNCTAGDSQHTHIAGGINDNDSLGPLQVLRHYVEANGCIEYPCGAATYDLMTWEDNVQYFFHRQCDIFSSDRHWNKYYEIKSKYELVALMAVAHNTGSAFHTAGSSSGNAGSLWRNAGAVFKYCELLGSPESVRVLNDFVDKWYQDTITKAESDREFTLAGAYRWDSGKFKLLLKELGVVQADYAASFGHKQIYPLRAVLNYMALERLYTSGSVVK